MPQLDSSANTEVLRLRYSLGHPLGDSDTPIKNELIYEGRGQMNLYCIFTGVKIIRQRLPAVWVEWGLPAVNKYSDTAKMCIFYFNESL